MHGHGSRGGRAYTRCTSTHNHGQDLNSLKLDLNHLIALKISLDLLTVVTKSVLTPFNTIQGFITGFFLLGGGGGGGGN